MYPQLRTEGKLKIDGVYVCPVPAAQRVIERNLARFPRSSTDFEERSQVQPEESEDE